uniref:RING-type domain-containing protein n=1 Tax=Meloidogyne hapla TaxID=6305 RepID=A0A1I8BEJ9_MELHA
MSLCIICNEVITGKSVLLKCRHVAHLICLTPHFLTNKVCPEDGMEVVCDIEIKLAKTCMKVKRSFSSTCADDSDESKEPKKMKSEKQKSAGKNVVTAVEQVTTVEPKNEYKHPHSIKQFIPQLFEDGENKENKQSCSGSSQTESKPVFSLQWDVKDAKRADMKASFLFLINTA